MTQTIYYATGNTAKFEEVASYIAAHEPSIQLLQFSEPLAEIQTRNQKEIALHKSRRAWERLHKPLLVDDAGIYFEKYGSFPGTLTRHVFQGIGYKGLMRLVKPHDRASFLINLVYVDPKGNPHVFEGSCTGQIVHPDSFETLPDFPYDALFMPDGSSMTYAELRAKAPEQAPMYSYRINAIKKFLEWWKTHEDSEE